MERISTGNRGLVWWSYGACALTAWGLVTETWALSTWSMQCCFDRHRSGTTSPTTVSQMPCQRTQHAVVVERGRANWTH